MRWKPSPRRRVASIKPPKELTFRLLPLSCLFFRGTVSPHWRKRVGEEEANRISHRASTRGTKVHEIIEKYIDNDENFRDGYTPDVLESFLIMKPILDGFIGTVYAQEAPLYSTHLGVAGRVDCVAEFDGQLSIIDFKTSRKKKKKDWINNYFMQEARICGHVGRTHGSTYHPTCYTHQC